VTNCPYAWPGPHAGMPRRIRVRIKSVINCYRGRPLPKKLFLRSPVPFLMTPQVHTANHFSQRHARSWLCERCHDAGGTVRVSFVASRFRFHTTSAKCEDGDLLTLSGRRATRLQTERNDEQSKNARTVVS
jgi:hypothetical protein